MSSVLSDEERRQHLLDLQAISSDADAHDEMLPVFLPLPSHASALHPSKLIVRGDRGAGKTALFHLLRELTQKDISIDEVFPGASAWEGRWLEGFSERGKTHPSTDVLELFCDESDDPRLRSFWFGHMVGQLADDPTLGGEQPPGVFIGAWREHRTDPAAWVDVARAELGPLTAWIDRLDDRCVRDRRRIFISYDHLDKIGITQPDTRRRFSSSLLSMWLSLSNRYERLRPKIFLREDLFQSSAQSSSDASKLESRSVRLHWSTEELYRLLVRHMAASPRLRDWLGSGRNKIDTREKRPLGWMPPEAMPEEEGRNSQRNFAEKLAGELMGDGVKKGYTHRWVPNHLQDTHGALVPRPILNLFAFAAEYALARGPKAQYSRLLHPTELQSALEKTSKYRARELAEEHKVVNRLRRLEGMTLLADRRDIIRRLSDGGPDDDDGFGNDGEAAFDELVHLGVFRVRDDERIDVPDIFRFGFGIKRKGGVRRPR